MDYRIFCALPDGRPTFPVKIAKTETVGDLKNAIKVEIPLSLNGIEARDLTLYQVNLDCSDKKEYIKQAKLLAENPGNLLELDPPETLTTVFWPSGPTEQKINILAVPPPGEPVNSRACG